MPKVDFYILSEPDDGASLRFVCRLIEKAYKNRHRVYIHTDNQTYAHALDELLWSFREDSFLPHSLYGDGPEPASPIQIGFGVTPEKQRDILINLSSEIPVFYSQFARVFVCVSNNAELQERAREQYRQYRADGCMIATHKLETSQSEIVE